MREGDKVQYIGPDAPEEQMWEGHPGRIVDAGAWPAEVTVLFVNGAALGMPPDELVLIDEVTYARLGHRTARCLHPLRDEPIPRTYVAGQEWPDETPPADPDAR